MRSALRIHTIGMRQVTVSGTFLLVLLAGCNATQNARQPVLSIPDDGLAHDLPATASRDAMHVEVRQMAEWGRNAADDIFHLRVSSKGSGFLAEKEFCSSYAKYQLDLIDLTGDGIEEFVLITGEGRGTSARAETLFVYRLQDGRFSEILAVPVSNFFGIGVAWWYDVRYVDWDANGTTDLRLILSHSPTDQTTCQSPEDIPRERVKEYRWVHQSGRMVASNDNP